jgi:hypothetical protein
MDALGCGDETAQTALQKMALRGHSAAAAAAPTCVDGDPCAVDRHVLAVAVISSTPSTQLGKCKAHSHEQITPAHECRHMNTM